LCEVATEPSQTAWLRDKLGKGRSEPAHGGPSPARAPSNGTDRDPIRDEELVELDALLSELCPQHRTTKKGVELEPDAPERMRRVWEALGESEATARLRVLRREESRAALERVFSDWAAEPRSLTSPAAPVPSTRSRRELVPRRVVERVRSDGLVAPRSMGRGAQSHPRSRQRADLRRRIGVEELARRAPHRDVRDHDLSTFARAHVDELGAQIDALGPLELWQLEAE